MEKDKLIKAVMERDFIDELALEVFLDAHRMHKMQTLPCAICHATPCGRHPFMNIPTTVPNNSNTSANTSSGSSGQQRTSGPVTIVQINQDTNLYECHSCHRRFPSQRYAQHLEKCLGMGRQTRNNR